MQLNTSAWKRCTNWKNHGITSSRKYLPDHVCEMFICPGGDGLKVMYSTLPLILTARPRAHMVTPWLLRKPWWRHQMETFSALLALCAGNSPVPVNSPHKGQWRGTLMFTLICARINDWVNNREAGDLRRHRGHYDVNVMRLSHYWPFNESRELPWYFIFTTRPGTYFLEKYSLRRWYHVYQMLKKSEIRHK